MIKSSAMSTDILSTRSRYKIRDQINYFVWNES